MNDSRRMRMAAELLKYMEELDAQDLQGAMAPQPEEMPADMAGGDMSVVAELDPEKTKQFEQGFKGALGGGGGAPAPVPPSGQPGPMDKLVQGDVAMSDEPDDEELDELERLNA